MVVLSFKKVFRVRFIVPESGPLTGPLRLLGMDTSLPVIGSMVLVVLKVPLSGFWLIQMPNWVLTPAVKEKLDIVKLLETLELPEVKLNWPEMVGPVGPMAKVAEGRGLVTGSILLFIPLMDTDTASKDGEKVKFTIVATVLTGTGTDTGCTTMTPPPGIPLVPLPKAVLAALEAVSELEPLATELVVHVLAVGEQTAGEALPWPPWDPSVLTTIWRLNISLSESVMP